MGLREYLFLATKNIRTYKKNTIIVIVSIVLVLIFAVSFITYIDSGNKELKQLLYHRASECCLSTSKRIDASQYGFYPEVKVITRHFYKGQLENYNLIINGTEHRFVNLADDFMMNPDDKFTNTNYYPLQIDVFGTEGVVFSKMDELEYNSRYGNNNLLLCGNLAREENEILVSASFLQLYGITDDYKSVIGKSLSVWSVNDNAFVIKNCTITGIVNSNYYKMCGTYEDSHLILCSNNYIMQNADYEETINRYYAVSYEQAAEMYNLAKSKGFPFNSNVSVETYESMLIQKNVVWKIILISVVLVTIMLLLYILVTEYFVCSERASFYVTEMYLGMKSKDILAILWIEKAICGLIALAISSATIPLVLTGIGELVMELFNTNLKFDYMIAGLYLLIAIMALVIYMSGIDCYLNKKLLQKL